MATITAPSHDAPTRTHQWRQDRVRAALERGRRKGAAMASTARHRYRRPVLVIGSFTSGVASAWHTFGTGAGLAACCIAGLIFESLGGEE